MRIHALLGTALAVSLACAPANDAPAPTAGEATATAEGSLEAGPRGETSGPVEAPTDANTVSLIGCVLQEDAYREVVGDDAAGVFGLGGTTDEYVLVGAILAPGTGGDEPMTPEDTAAAYLAAIARSAGHAYVLEGGGEDDIARGTGRLVQVVGTLSSVVDEPVTPDGSAAATAAAMEVDALPVLEIGIWHEVGDYCPASEA